MCTETAQSFSMNMSPFCYDPPLISSHLISSHLISSHHSHPLYLMWCEALQLHSTLYNVHLSHLLSQYPALACLWVSEVHGFVQQFVHDHEVVTYALFFQLSEIILEHLQCNTTQYITTQHISVTSSSRAQLHEGWSTKLSFILIRRPRCQHCEMKTEEKYVMTYIGEPVEEEQNKRNIRIPFRHCHQKEIIALR